MFTCGTSFFGSSGPSDPFWANVVSLLYFNGTNGSTSIIDEKSGNVWTASGGAKLTTSTSKFGTSCLDCTSATSRISTPYASWQDFGSADFTIEFFYKSAAVKTGYTYTYINRAGSSSQGPVALGVTSGNIYYNVACVTLGSWAYNTGSSGPTPSLVSFDCLAITRSGTTMRSFVNGNIFYSGTISGSLIVNSVALSIGANLDGTQSSNGYIDCVRITKGVARYTSNYTPPTTPFPNH